MNEELSRRAFAKQIAKTYLGVSNLGKPRSLASALSNKPPQQEE